MSDIYTVEKIVGLVRDALDDTAQPYLVSDEQIVTAIDDAQFEFAEKTLCLVDSHNFSLNLTSGNAWYDIDSQILKVVSGYLQGAKRIVQVCNREYRTGSDMMATGTPSEISTQYGVGLVRLWPIPVVADTMRLTVFIYPMPLESVDDSLTIPDRWRRTLVAGAMSKLVLNQQLELYSHGMSGQWQQEWAVRLGEAAGNIERDMHGPRMVRISSTGVWG